MLDALAIARRIKSRFARVTDAYAAGPLPNGRDAYVDLLTRGRTYRAYVSLLLEGDPRPASDDTVPSDRPAIDQVSLAALASAHIASMAKVCQHPEEQASLKPWFRDGTSGFVVRCAFGTRFLVEVTEVKPLSILLAAREAEPA